MRSVNGVAVVADRITMSADDTQASVFSVGTAAVANEHSLLVGGSGQLSGQVTVVNPAPDTIARIEVLAFRDGNTFTVTQLEVQPGGRTVMNLAGLGVPADAVLVLRSNEPVAAEASLSIDNAARVPVALVPEATSLAAPDLPI